MAATLAYGPLAPSRASPYGGRAAAPQVAVPSLRVRTCVPTPLRRVLPNPAAPVQRPAVQVQAKKSTNVAASSVVPTGEPPAEEFKFVWGAKMKELCLCVGLATVVYNLPIPAGVTAQAWHLLALFLGTVVGIITQPLPLGAVALMGLGAAMATGTMSFAAAFSGFSNEIPWLIAIAFWLSKGFISSGLGNRIAYMIVSAFGSTTLGLTYSLVAAEALLAPAIPAVGARTGGIFVPLATALCKACGSDPADGTENKMGTFVMSTCFQTSIVSCAMFITAMAANPLCVNLAAATIGHTISWGQWAGAAIVPGLICLATVPLINYFILSPPELKNTPDAPVNAREQLKALGPISLNEKITAGAFLLTVYLWIAGAQFGINSIAAALIGLGILLVSNVVTWKECLSNNTAWDTLTWFAALIAMGSYLNTYGFIPWFSEQVVAVVGGMGLSWQLSFGIVSLLYFYSHYLFASASAHIGAMFTAFLTVATSCGTPPVLAALFLSQLSNLMGCLTTFGFGAAPPYFGTGYVPQPHWYKVGGVLSVWYLLVWGSAAFSWWKIMGIW